MGYVFGYKFYRVISIDGSATKVVYCDTEPSPNIRNLMHRSAEAADLSLGRDPRFLARMRAARHVRPVRPAIS